MVPQCGCLLSCRYFILIEEKVLGTINLSSTTRCLTEFLQTFVFLLHTVWYILPIIHYSSYILNYSLVLIFLKRDVRWNKTKYFLFLKYVSHNDKIPTDKLLSIELPYHYRSPRNVTIIGTMAYFASASDFEMLVTWLSTTTVAIQHWWTALAVEQRLNLSQLHEIKAVLAFNKCNSLCFLLCGS